MNLLSAGGRKDYLNGWEQLFTKVTNGLVAAKLENRILLMGRVSSLTKRITENLDLPEDVYNFDGKYHYSTLTKCCYSFFCSVLLFSVSVCQPNSVILQLLVLSGKGANSSQQVLPLGSIQCSPQTALDLFNQRGAVS